jgi:very-short-patch-repair endonuclease
MALKCRECGAPFERYRCQVKGGRGIYCSRTCVGIAGARRGSHVSAAEVAFFDALEARGVEVIRQKRIGTFVVDGYVPAWNKVIEIDGEYWHSLPAMKERDQRKGAYIVAAGYGLTRVRVGRVPLEGIKAEKLAVAFISCYGRMVAA